MRKIDRTLKKLICKCVEDSRTKRELIDSVTPILDDYEARGKIYAYHIEHELLGKRGDGRISFLIKPEKSASFVLLEFLVTREPTAREAADLEYFMGKLYHSLSIPFGEEASRVKPERRKRVAPDRQ